MLRDNHKALPPVKFDQPTVVVPLEVAIEMLERSGKTAQWIMRQTKNGPVVEFLDFDEFAALCERCGITLPKTIPEDGWGEIFMSPTGPFNAEDFAPPPESSGNSQRRPASDEGIIRMEPLTFRRLNEILAMEFDDGDFVLANGYLTKGEPGAICGAGGIGKSRLVTQLVRDILIGEPFLGRWPTNGQNLTVMVLQSENSNRRMKSDLCAQTAALTQAQKDYINDHCVWHTLENSDDSFLALASDENQQRIEDAIAQYKPELIVWDVLRDFAVDDPSSDKFMQQSLSIIGRLTRKYNAQCIALILHHGRTGKAGAASATGFDRGSFGRNSKVLFSWTRSQINVAPYTADNKTLVVASGKCNNAEEFKPFAVTLNTKTMSYEVDESVTEEDIAVWHEEMGASSGIKKKQQKKKSPEQIKAAIMKLVPETGTVPKYEVAQAANDADISRNDVRDYIKILLREKRLFEGKVREGKSRSEVHLSRQEIVSQEEPNHDEESSHEQTASDDEKTAA
jgi:RecA-family ATPase